MLLPCDSRILGVTIARDGERGSVGSPALTACSPWVRGTIAAGALALAAMLAGCETDGVDLSALYAKALKPLSPAMVVELERKHIPKESPILVLMIEQETDLEV